MGHEGFSGMKSGKGGATRRRADFAISPRRRGGIEFA
jgi:hypothetical protein